MSDTVERKVPLAVLVAIVVQTAGALVWAGGAAARIGALESRMERQGSVAERLARLEAQGEAMRAALARIEQRMEGRR